MKKFGALVAVPLLMVGMLGQTGCVAGSITGNFPLTMVGIGMTGGGVLISTTGIAAHDDQRILTGLVIGLAGIALDAENPGRQEALNPIPLTPANAKALGVGLADLEEYNEEALNNVIETDQLIEGAIQKIASKKESVSFALNNLAPELGLSDGEQLMDVVKGDKLQRNEVRSFALARGISETSAKIYLQTRWSVKLAR